MPFIYLDGGCTSWSYIIFYKASAYALHGITVKGGGSQNCKEKCHKIFEWPQILKKDNGKIMSYSFTL